MDFNNNQGKTLISKYISKKSSSPLKCGVVFLIHFNFYQATNTIEILIQNMLMIASH